MSKLIEKSKYLFEQGKTILFSMTVSEIIAGMLGAVIILFILHITEPQPKPIGTVNITGIVNQFVKSQAKLDLPPKVLQQRVNDFGKQLQASLDDISHKHHVVLMVQEAVISGSQDYTEEVKHRLSALQTATDTAK